MPFFCLLASTIFLFLSSWWCAEQRSSWRNKLRPSRLFPSRRSYLRPDYDPTDSSDDGNESKPLVVPTTTTTAASIMAGGKSTSFADGTPESDMSIHARKVLATRLTGVRGNMAGVSTRQMVQKANISGLIFPWMIGFKIWWSIISAATIFTVFYSPYFIAFGTGATGVSAAIYYILLLLFLLDMGVKFNLAFYANGVLVYDRRQIARNYLRRMFWVDLIGVFPFDVVAMAAAGVLGQDSREAELLSLLNLLIYARLYRLKKLSDMLQYSTRISFAAFTLIRNYFVALAVTHFSGCIMYFIARLDDFGEDTWIGPVVDGMTGWERYVASLYWSVTTVRRTAMLLCLRVTTVGVWGPYARECRTLVGARRVFGSFLTILVPPPCFFDSLPPSGTEISMRSIPTKWCGALSLCSSTWSRKGAYEMLPRARSPPRHAHTHPSPYPVCSPFHALSFAPFLSHTNSLGTPYRPPPPCDSRPTAGSLVPSRCSSSRATKRRASTATRSPP